MIKDLTLHVVKSTYRLEILLTLHLRIYSKFPGTIPQYLSKAGPTIQQPCYHLSDSVLSQR